MDVKKAESMYKDALNLFISGVNEKYNDQYIAKTNSSQTTTIRKVSNQKYRLNFYRNNWKRKTIVVSKNQETRILYNDIGLVDVVAITRYEKEKLVSSRRTYVYRNSKNNVYSIVIRKDLEFDDIASRREIYKSVVDKDSESQMPAKR